MNNYFPLSNCMIAVVIQHASIVGYLGGRGSKLFNLTKIKHITQVRGNSETVAEILKWVKTNPSGKFLFLGVN